jgi:deazaflavin-dependent oxidoreductase (nitroreductase family)
MTTNHDNNTRTNIATGGEYIASGDRDVAVVISTSAETSAVNNVLYSLRCTGLLTGSLATMIDQPATFGRPYLRHVAWRQGLLTKTHTVVYRLSGGRIGATLLGMPMLLLTTWGRRTGKLRMTPLLYLPVDDVFVLVASNGGAKQHPTWWFNLQAYPEALVQIGPVRGRVHAVPATDAEHQRFWPLSLQVYPPYAQYQGRTDRQIPLLVLHPIETELFRHVPTHYKQIDVQ